MRTLTLVLTAALLFPTLAAAQASPSAAPAPAAAPAAPPAATPAATPTSTATPTATPTSTATTAAAPAAPKEPEYSSYFVLKGGWFGSSGDFEGDDFSGNGTWEVAVGTGRTFGVELAGGSMTTSAGNLEVRTIPLLLSLRLQIPIAMVYPFGEAGIGLYFNRVSVGGGRDLDDTTLGWHAGLGCDVHLGRVLVGAQARYMGISPTFETIGTLTLDRYELLLRGGVLF